MVIAGRLAPEPELVGNAPPLFELQFPERVFGPEAVVWSGLCRVCRVRAASRLRPAACPLFMAFCDSPHGVMEPRGQHPKDCLTPIRVRYPDIPDTLHTKYKSCGISTALALTDR